MSTLAVTQRTTLGGFTDYPNFTDKHFVEWRPATYGDALKAQSMDPGTSEAANVAASIEIVGDRIVRGLMPSVDEEGKVIDVPYERAHLAQLPIDIMNRILADVMGVAIDDDPKDETQTPATTSSSEAPNSGIDPTTSTTSTTKQ